MRMITADAVKEIDPETIAVRTAVFKNGLILFWFCVEVHTNGLSTKRSRVQLSQCHELECIMLD